MARFFGQRSKYLVKMGLIDALAAIVYFLIMAWTVYAVIHAFGIKLFNLVTLVVVVVMFTPLLWFIYHLYRKSDSESKDFLQGLRSEDSIAKVLKTLPYQYSVYADVKIKPEFGNIDYVVIGPTGLFAIEVKSHRGIIEFNGSELVRQGKKFEKDFLKQSMSEAMSLHEHLRERLETEIFVKPVLVFSNWVKIDFGLDPVRNVFVVQKRWLKKLIESQTASNFIVGRQQIEKELQSLARKDK